MYQIVQVYWNSHKGLWSVRDKAKRKVIDHSSTLFLSGASFIVNERGRQRVLREQRKNVHAYVEGFLREDLLATETFDPRVYKRVGYNPYFTDRFCQYDGESLLDRHHPIERARLVLFMVPSICNSEDDQKQVWVRF